MFAARIISNRHGQSFIGKGVDAMSVVLQQLAVPTEFEVWLGESRTTKVQAIEDALAIRSAIWRQERLISKGGWYDIAHERAIAIAKRAVPFNRNIENTPATTLDAVMKALDVDAETLAVIMGLNPSTVSRALRGDCRLSYEHYERIRSAAEDLGVESLIVTAFPRMSRPTPTEPGAFLKLVGRD